MFLSSVAVSTSQEVGGQRLDSKQPLSTLSRHHRAELQCTVDRANHGHFAYSVHYRFIRIVAF